MQLPPFLKLPVQTTRLVLVSLDLELFAGKSPKTSSHMLTVGQDKTGSMVWVEICAGPQS